MSPNSQVRRSYQVLERRPFLRALFLFFRGWLIAAVVLVALYFGGIRDYLMTWGATPEEASRYMAGDEMLVDPTLNATRVVEIKAPPAQVWPWLVQMGYKRAGLYTFGALDNGGMPSAERIIPEFQDLEVGDDILPLLQVVEMEPNKSMLWVFDERAGPWANATWSWGLYETEEGHTRLASRLRQQYIFDSPQAVIGWALLDPMEICMMRTTLLGIKRRVEGY
jgi:hypothetical protein